MKIRAKLGAFVAIAALGLAAGLGGQAALDGKAAALDVFAMSGQRVLTEYYALADSAKAALYEDRGLDELYEAWSGAYARFAEDVDAFFASPAIRSLPASERERLREADLLRRSMASDFMNADANVRYLIGSNQMAAASKRGLFPTLRALEADLSADPLLAYKFLGTADLLATADGKARDFLVGTLQALIVDLEVLIAERARTYRVLSFAIIGAFAAALVVAASLFGSSLSRRIVSVEAVVRRIKERDLTGVVEDGGADELGSLAANLREVVSDMRSFLGGVALSMTTIEELDGTLSAGTEESGAALDQISRNIESMRALFADLAGRISSASDSVSSIAAEIDVLAGVIEDQSLSIRKNASSLEEMDASLRGASGAAAENRGRAEKFRSFVREGEATMEASVGIMGEVREELERILDINEIIEGISERTNVLSINAAIESAHAGAQGKGFSVVAEEIGRLAASTADNSRSIEASLASIASRISEASGLADRSFAFFTSIGSETAGLADSLAAISADLERLGERSREVLALTRAIDSIAVGIGERSASMRAAGKAVDDAMRTSSSISAEAALGIGEIERGAKEILLSIGEMGGVANDTRFRVEELRVVVEAYKV